MATSLKLSVLAIRYTIYGFNFFDRITINSVEPTAPSSDNIPVTKPVFPFSRHGVIRANSVSLFLNLLPEFDCVSVKSLLLRTIDEVLNADIGTLCFIRSLSSFVVGLKATTSSSVYSLHPSGTPSTIFASSHPGKRRSTNHSLYSRCAASSRSFICFRLFSIRSS